MTRLNEPSIEGKKLPFPYFCLASIVMVYLERAAKLWNGSFFGPSLYDELSMIGTLFAVVSLLRRESLWLLSALVLACNLVTLSVLYWW